MAEHLMFYVACVLYSVLLFMAGYLVGKPSITPITKDDLNQLRKAHQELKAAQESLKQTLARSRP